MFTDVGLSSPLVPLVSDLMVLLLSLTDLPVACVAASLVTAIPSGQIIGWIQLVGVKKEK